MIYLSLVLGEITDREAALRQCYRALKTGGLLSITELQSFFSTHTISAAGPYACLQKQPDLFPIVSMGTGLYLR
jgi:ubiquinone/menaquinone biosynthesis C-methylase UbiE